MSLRGRVVAGVGYWGPSLVRIALAPPDLRLKWLGDLGIERVCARRSATKGWSVGARAPGRAIAEVPL